LKDFPSTQAFDQNFPLAWRQATGSSDQTITPTLYMSGVTPDFDPRSRNDLREQPKMERHVAAHAVASGRLFEGIVRHT
jgi:hypothetical protein